MTFELGQSVLISYQFHPGDLGHMAGFENMRPWREGTVTAVAADGLRIRTMTKWPWGKVRWISLRDPHWSVCPVTE
ncbi:MAG: hypothetical protein V4726_00845 [Verrucomicrobiota bacterium]